MTIWRWAMAGGMLAGLGWPATGVAQIPESRAREISAAIVKVLVPVGIAKHVAAQCDAIAPEARDNRQAALGRWRAAHRVDVFEAAVGQFFRRLPRTGEALQKIETTTAGAAKSILQKAPGICADMDMLLAEGTFGVLAQINAALAQIAAFTPGGQGSPPVAAQPRATTIYTMAQLSAKVQAAMNAAAPAEAAKDRKTRELRENAAQAALKTLGIVAVRGRAIERERLRGWHDDRQSTFSARCRSFVDDATKDRFQALRGQDVAVGGEVGSVHDDGEGGGTITFTKCALIDDVANLSRADLPEEGGFELRPPEPDEAYAGPGAGIPPEQVAKVVYKANFAAGMDGFGNGYTKRDEDTYVLLKDGTAYHHHWRFPFSDVNLLLVRHREPGRWFTWREESGKLHLTATGGRLSGQTSVVEGYDTLEAVPAGARWEKAFYYLNVEMMGTRIDRNYAFHTDGTLDVKTSSFVAGNTGAGAGSNVSGPGFAYSGRGSQGFLIVDDKDSEMRLRYRIDGYVLELSDEAGKAERHFVARFGSDKNDPPSSLYLDGEVLWTRDKKDGK
jgi:hypothetical protein